MKKKLLVVFGVMIILLLAGFLYVKTTFDNMYAQSAGFKTFGYSLLPYKNGTERIPFLVREDGEYLIKYGAVSVLGNVTVSLVDSNGSPILYEHGRNNRFSQKEYLTKGEYEFLLEFHHTLPTNVVVSITKEDPSTGNQLIDDVALDQRFFTRAEPNPQAGFQWPYYLYTPANITNRHLLVIPINSGINSDDNMYHELYVKDYLLSVSRYGDQLGCPILMPVFPRPKTDAHIYTHALDRDSLTAAREDIRRLDNQLVAMIDHAGEGFVSRKTDLDSKVLLLCFSASGMFSNRFALLHPDRVQAAAIGSPGGWPIAPMSEFAGLRSRYPVGAADLEELTHAPLQVEEFRKVPLFFFLGAEDTNDSVPFEDSFDPADAKLIMDTFGKTPVERWPAAEELYRTVGSSSTFKLYPNIGHMIHQDMEADILQFYKEHSGSK